jgi:SAM-dependent methyltransferase
MTPRRAILSLAALALTATVASAQTATQKPFEPREGQAGKDVVWVPTPQSLVDKMLDMAKVTSADVVMDLGSGDGRTVITAAKLGATAIGIEYNPDMVELSKRNAEAAGVTGKATFIKADLFETDLSKASVITMFLLPKINMRIVSNTFSMEDWQPDDTATVTNNCDDSWCTALFWVVPAKVAGTWTLPSGTLTLTQNFQMFSGMLGNQALQGKLNGANIAFTAGTTSYVGTVNGNTITFTQPSAITATRKP